MNTNYLATIRKCKGFTQQELADKIGITRQQISAIETGQSRPSVDTAKLIATELGIRWDYFFTSPNNIIPQEGASENV